MLEQIDQARSDLYGITEDLAVIQAQGALLPTPGSPRRWRGWRCLPLKGSARASLWRGRCRRRL